MRTLHIDIETYSDVDLKVAGQYKYAENCEIILFGYKYDNGPTIVIDLTFEDIPTQVICDMCDENFIKKAHNAAFERACIQAFLNIYTPPEQWRCTMVHAAMAGLPFSLDDVTRVLDTSDKKDAEGKALIRYFCIPCKPTKTNGMRTRNLPEHAPDKWIKFIKYCGVDVDAECSVSEKLTFYKYTESAHREWCLDQRINERGIYVDRRFASSAITMDAKLRTSLLAEASRISGLENANSDKQLKTWLTSEMPFEGEVESLTKDNVVKLLKISNSDVVTRMLTIRQELAKTSISKYNKMITCACNDGRLRGMLQHYGANRTGRAAGRLLQLQNLPIGDVKNVEEARKLVLDGDVDFLFMCYQSVANVLSSLIRSGIIPAKNKKLLVSDFSAIEARVIAWLAGEDWKLDIFRTHGKIYEAAAAKMFGINIEDVTKDGYHRKAGKVAELAAGYQGGANALARMCVSLKITELPEKDMPNIVTAWRKANPNIVRYWKTCENAAKEAIRTGECQPVGKGIYFEYKNKCLFITLPSGRKLSYYNARLIPGKFGDQVAYWNMDKSWMVTNTYGGKLVENIVQAVARDCLYFALLNVDKAGYYITMHVHDEIVAEEGLDSNIEQLDKIMEQLPPWADGLPLKADGFETFFYKK